MAVVVLALLTIGLAGPAPAAAGSELSLPASSTKAPEGMRLSAERVIELAGAHPTVRAELSQDSPGARPTAYIRGQDWQVGWFTGTGDDREEVAQARVDDATGEVTEAWRDWQVRWTMARGRDGAFGRDVAALWLWVPLLVAFVVPFVDRRRPVRLLHLDLAVLCAFSISLAFFNDGAIDVSVPLVYPLLAYLLARMLWIGLRRKAGGGPAPHRSGSGGHGRPLGLAVPVPWLVVGIIFLLGFRVGLNIADSNVIDVGYAGVIGADRLSSGEPLYGAFPDDNPAGDTYGPVNYLAYVPFVAALGWDGTWSELPAAHGAAIAFDILAVVLAFLLGRRARGPALGVALAYAWVSFPFTLYVANSNANDALVTVLVLGAVLAALWSARPLAAAGRGSLTALAGLTKLAPLALGPLLLTHRGEGERLRPSTTAVFLVAFAVVAALAFLPELAGGGSLRAFWDATLGYQLERGSPFSVWGQWDLGAAQKVVQVAAVALAVGLAIVPRRRDAVGLSALCAAILIALQLGVTHWFYLYIVWFFPLVMLALLVTSTEGHPLAVTGGRNPSHPLAVTGGGNRFTGTAKPVSTPARSPLPASAASSAPAPR
ncbi:MAG TPA: hypothetical protein VGW11_06045 [Solirubrobacteraceae bacterium]|nr:hypothetical protein [Solirubrobacteraceae bacterium]